MRSHSEVVFAAKDAFAAEAVFSTAGAARLSGAGKTEVSILFSAFVKSR
jgi:hypothetical protein